MTLDQSAQMFDTISDGGVLLDPEILYDLTDLLSFFSHSRTVSGIQRVVLCLVTPGLRRGATAVVFNLAQGVWRTVPTAVVERLWVMSTQISIAQAADWLALASEFAQVCDRGTPVTFTTRSLLVSLGANWSAPSTFASLRQLRSQYGVRTATFIHDVVPLLYPEYCNPDTRSQFGRWIASTLMQVDVIIVNSRTTAADLLKVSQALGLKQRQPIVCCLNGRFPVRPVEAKQILNPSVAEAAAAPFVLFVGTLEPRKNHLFVLTAWRAAQEMIGSGKMPNLVLVGKPGWDYSPIMTALASYSLRKTVSLLSDVSDVQLSHLYANCLFTIYNSFYEGWGLPVTESLAHGKVPVVPRHSALIESGADSAEFFEAGSQKDFLDTIMRLVTDPSYLSRRTAELPYKSKLREWDAISHELNTELVRTTSCRPLLPVLESGSILHIRNIALDTDLANYALSESVRVDGWHDLEDWGCWTSSPMFRLAFRYGQAVVESNNARWDESDQIQTVVLYLLLKAPDTTTELTIFVNGCRCLHSVPISGRRAVSVRFLAKPGQDLEFSIEQSQMEDLTARTNNYDRRTIGVGVEAVMACQDTDVAARLRFLEFQAGYQSTIV